MNRLPALKTVLEAGADLDPADRTGLEANTFLRAFSPREFVWWPSWKKLLRLLSSNGGCYGLYGPRGAGKTWHLRHAVHRAQKSNGIGVWYPSPSEYESSAFLLALTETLAADIQKRWRKMHPGRRLPTEDSTAQRLLISVLVGICVFVGVSMWSDIAQVRTFASSAAFAIVMGLLAGLLLFMVFDNARRRVLGASTEASLLLEAKRLREAVRFSLNRRESLEVGGQAGAGVVGKLMSRSERELSERPLTLSTLIQDFRGLAEQAGKVVEPEPVVIAIDELDKMADHERVRQLLRDIKGIFDIPNVYFLVSVSSEAARALNLNGLAERNEFNSSFEDVIELPPLDVRSCRELLEERGGQDLPERASALAVLSGGIPREIVRLAERVFREGARDDVGRRAGVAAAIQVEALELRGLVVSASDEDPAGALSQSAKTGVFDLLDTKNFSPEAFPRFAATALEQWSPSWADDVWSARFEEAWRRLLVRIYVAGILARSGGQELLESAQDLQNIVVTSAQSATVAARLIKRLDPQAVDVAPTDAEPNMFSWRGRLLARLDGSEPAGNDAARRSRRQPRELYIKWG